MSNNRHAWAKQRQATFGDSRQGSLEYDEVEMTLGEKLKHQVKRRFLIWIIILILAALTVHDVVNLVRDYAAYPKVSEMNMMFNDSMKMPDMTFCMPKSLVLGHLKPDFNKTTEEWDAHIHNEIAKRPTKEEFLAPGWDHEMYFEAYDVIANLNSLERETHPQGMARSVANFAQNPRLAEKVATIAFWLDAIHDRNVSFQEFTDKVGIGTLGMSLMAFQRLTYDDDQVVPTGISISWLSIMQMCFQPTFNKTVNIDDQGTFFKLQLKHDNESLYSQAHECLSVDFHGRPSSMARFMEGKGRAKDGFSDSLCVSQKSDVTVEVRALYQMLANDDNGTACRGGGSRDNDKDNNVEVEAEFDCRSRCRMEMIQRLCNCTGNTLQYLQDPEKLHEFPYCDYSKCMIDPETEETDQVCAKRCYRSCEQVRYEIDFQDEGPMVNKEVTLIVLNWGSFEYLTLEQKWEWSLSTFFAALGGSIGMWLGLSILTVIQGIEFVTAMMTKEVKHKRHGAKMKRQQTIDKTSFSGEPNSNRSRNHSSTNNPNVTNGGSGYSSNPTNGGSGYGNSGFQPDNKNKNGSTSIMVD